MDPLKPKSLDPVARQQHVRKKAAPADPAPSTSLVDSFSLQSSGEPLKKAPAAESQSPSADPVGKTSGSSPEQIEKKSKTQPNQAYNNGPQAQLDGPLTPQASGKTLAQLSSEVSEAPTREMAVRSRPLSSGRKAGLLRRMAHGLLSLLSSDPLDSLQADFQEIQKLGDKFQDFKTPQQFQAKTSEFKALLKAGASLAEIRNEAYALARQACSVSLGMRPYDCQVLGALAMDDGKIAEMRTGEGKTLTAVLPLYLNALAGEGAHLVTVNDTLAARDAKDMAPAFELLGLTVGTVLEDMKQDEKRAGYAADVTYTTDRSLGFDYLRDLTVKHPDGKVQRAPFFALIDEVDEVLIDEARSPLIISNISNEGESLAQDYLEFDAVVKELKANSDYFIDHKQHTVWPSETGFSRIENILQRRSLEKELATQPAPERLSQIKSELTRRLEFSEVIAKEQTAFQNLRDTKRAKPNLLQRWRGANWDESDLKSAETKYEKAQRERLAFEKSLPRFDLFSKKHAHLTRFLYAALKANTLFQVEDNYTIDSGKVEIVDENKGRTSVGRRYNDGVHQAIEAKEGLPVGPESQTTASITYPNLFERYPRLAGMSGTAKTSEAEFLKLYDLSVTPIPTNEPVIREDHPDLVFQTLEEKYHALASDAAADFFAGKPVLIGTLSVEHNEYLAELLRQKGVPEESLQVLNADTVRGDKSLENEMIARAGRSGMLTVATNMAGRGANIKPDLVNFTKLSKKVANAHLEGRPVAVNLTKKKEAQWLQGWLAQFGAQVVPSSHPQGPGSGQIQIRYGEGLGKNVTPEFSEMTLVLEGNDFPTGGLQVYGSERSSSRRIDNQLIGRSGRQGAPGSSRFYLSLEDDLLRIFGGDKLETVLGLFMEPGKGVRSDAVDFVVAQAQQSVESEHFASRETSHKRDEALNHQREVFFHFREGILAGGQEMSDTLNALVGDAVVEQMMKKLPSRAKSFQYSEMDTALQQLREELQLPVELPFLKGKTPGRSMNAEDLEHELRDWVDRRTARMLRTLGRGFGSQDNAVRPLVLEELDRNWSEHLFQMETLSTGIGLQALAEKDPEVEFPLRAFELFEDNLSLTQAKLASGVYRELLALSELLNPSEKPAPSAASSTL